MQNKARPQRIGKILLPNNLKKKKSSRIVLEKTINFEKQKEQQQKDKQLSKAKI